MLALFLTLGGAPLAAAQPLSMTFTEARGNVGVQLSDAALFEAPNVAPLTAEIDPTSGVITNGLLEVPQFSTHITDPLDADVTVDFEIGVIDGIFNQTTGTLVLEGEAGGTLTSEGKECTVTTDPPVLALSTAGSSGGDSPRSGSPFTSGLPGPGAIAGEWDDMSAEPAIPGEGVAVCDTVDERIEGPGGIWLQQKGVVVPPPANKGGDNPPPSTPPTAPACIVPTLRGKTLARAKAALKAANCTLGKVGKLKGLSAKRKLVVKSSNPRAGATPINGKVHLKLGPKPRR